MHCVCCNTEMNIVAKSKRYIYFRCQNCKFWTSRLLNGEWPVLEYDDRPTFDSSAHTNWGDLVKEAEKIMTHKFRIFHKASKDSNKLRFLDIGCSEGVYVAACQNLGWDAYGYEIDEAKISRAQKRGLRVVTFQIDDHDSKIQNFDFILMRHTIEHIPNFIDVIEYSLSMLAVGGGLCIEVPNQGGFVSAIRRGQVKEDRFLANLYPPTHLHAFEKKTFRELGKNTFRIQYKIHTYSPADSSWSMISQYPPNSFKRIMHLVASKMRIGENLCIYFKK